MSTSRSRGSTSSKIRNEDFFIRRRNAEQDRLQLWNNVNQYFHEWDVRSSMFNTWTSPEYYNSSNEQITNGKLKREKESSLSIRRQRLAELLNSEDKIFEEELKALNSRKCPSDFNRLPLEELKNINLELKKREEEKCRREAELKLYHRWKSSTPTIREFERQQYRRFVRDAWINQVAEKREERKQTELELIEAYKEKEKQRLLDEEKEKEEINERNAKALSLQEELKYQMEILREQEKRAEFLKKEEALELEHQAELENIRIQRKIEEERKKHIELRTFNQHQYQLKLKEKTKEVQDNIDKEEKLMQKILEIEKEELAEKDERRKLAKQETEKTLSLFRQYKNIEKQRERDMEFLFYEEARQMWQKQHEVWKKEEEARKILLNDVLETLHKQIEEKLKINHENQKELVRNREELLNHLDSVNKELKQQQEASYLLKKEKKKIIDDQVAEKRKEMEQKILEEQEEKLKHLEQAKQEEEKILEELKKMDSKGYRPQNLRRKQFLW